MAAKYPLSVVLGVIDNLTAGMNRAVKGLERSGSALTSLGKKVTLGVGLPILGIGVAATMAGLEVDRGLARAELRTGATAGEMAAARKEIDELGVASGRGSRAASAAFAALAEEGADVRGALDGVRGALALSDLAQQDAGESARSLADLLDAYGLAAGQSMRVTDAVARGALVAGAAHGDFADSLRAVGPAARSVGVGVEDVAAQLAVLRARGFSATEASSGLKAVYLQLAKAGAIGADGTLRLGDALGRLEAGGVRGDQLFARFGRSAGPALAALLETGAGGLAAMRAQLDATRGALDQVDVLNGGTAGSVRQLTAAWDSLLVTLAGSGLLEFLGNAATMLGGMLTELQQSNPELLRWGVAIGGLGVVLGPAITGLGGLAHGLSFAFKVAGLGLPVMRALWGVMVANPIGAVIAGVAGLVAAGVYLWKNWDTVKEKLGAVWKAIGGGFAWLWDHVLAGVRKLGELLPDWLRDRLGLTTGGSSSGAPPPASEPVPMAASIFEPPPSIASTLPAGGLQQRAATDGRVTVRFVDPPESVRVAAEGVDVDTDPGFLQLGLAGG